MPLRDHFHEPVDRRAVWQSFHNRWANSIADALDRMLPPRFCARVEINLGRDVAADVAEFDWIDGIAINGAANAGDGGVAVQSYAPPAVGLVLPVVYSDETAIQVIDIDRGQQLAAVVEIVSPSNKDRPSHRRAFATKLVAYLQKGVGVAVVDVVTSHHFNLHQELVEALELSAETIFPESTLAYAVGYRPAHREERDEIDIWPFPLTVGQGLPIVPLALRGFGCVPLDLEGTYEETCRRSRLV